MTERHTANTITDDALDQLYDQLRAAKATAGGMTAANRRLRQQIADLAAQIQQAQPAA